MTNTLPMFYRIIRARNSRVCTDDKFTEIDSITSDICVLAYYAHTQIHRTVVYVYTIQMGMDIHAFCVSVFFSFTAQEMIKKWHNTH